MTTGTCDIKHEIKSLATPKRLSAQAADEAEKGANTWMYARFYIVQQMTSLHYRDDYKE